MGCSYCKFMLAFLITSLKISCKRVCVLLLVSQESYIVLKMECLYIDIALIHIRELPVYKKNTLQNDYRCYFQNCTYCFVQSMPHQLSVCSLVSK